MAAAKRSMKQQTLEATFGRSIVKSKQQGGNEHICSTAKNNSAAVVQSSSPLPPSSSMNFSFMGSSQLASARKKMFVVRDVSSEDSSESENEPEVSVEMSIDAPNDENKGNGSSSSSKSSSDDSDEESEAKLPFRRIQRTKRRISTSSSEAADNNDNKIASGRPEKPIVDDTDDDDDKPLQRPATKRRRLVCRNSVQAQNTSNEDNDENEDEEQPELRVITRRTRSARRPLTAKAKALERLRRKKAGQAVDDDESSSEEEERKPLYDYDPDHMALQEFPDDEEGVIQLNVDNQSKENHRKKRSGDDDSAGDMDDFIDDDSDQPIGFPEDVEIPMQFSKWATQPLKFHFKIVIEWLIKFKLNPGFKRDMPIYQIAWRKIDDEVQGLSHSKFSSSVWRVDFSKALRARPYIETHEIPKNDAARITTCDACGRTNHPASWVISFKGAAYHKKTGDLTRFLEPVKAESSDNGGESDEDSDVDWDEDEDGNDIPKATKQWFVGANCSANAETSHTLLHWKINLLNWVDTRLSEEGHMTPAKVAERKRMSAAKREEVTYEVVNTWMNSQIVSKLYREFKAHLEEARNRSTKGRAHHGG